MVVDTDGLNVLPVAIEVPPEAVVYQRTDPADAVAERVTVPDPQTDPGVVPVIVGKGSTVARTGVLVPTAHPEAINASA